MAMSGSKYAKWSKIGKTFTSSIRGCARCDGDGHEDLEWKPFTYPIEYGDPDGFVATHWCLCPTNGEPITMGGYDDDPVAE
jgi:hypothetical protein